MPDPSDVDWLRASMRPVAAGDPSSTANAVGGAGTSSAASPKDLLVQAVRNVAGAISTTWQRADRRAQELQTMRFGSAEFLENMMEWQEDVSKLSVNADLGSKCAGKCAYTLETLAKG
jgi:hypothetical protein